MYRLALLALVAAVVSAQSFETPALQISRNYSSSASSVRHHSEPGLSSPESNEIVSYSRCGDSAIWTGHYLAAESFRYAVTHSPESSGRGQAGAQGDTDLGRCDRSGRLLSRCVLRVDSPLSAGPRDEEKQHGEYRGTVDGVDYYWIADTSRDQYLGVIFGLSVAYDQLPDDRPTIQRNHNQIDRQAAREELVGDHAER